MGSEAILNVGRTDAKGLGRPSESGIRPRISRTVARTQRLETHPGRRLRLPLPNAREFHVQAGEQSVGPTPHPAQGKPNYSSNNLAEIGGILGLDRPVMMLESPLVSPLVAHSTKIGSRTPSLGPGTRAHAAPRIERYPARVLIVDDNYVCRQALVEAFRREGDFSVCGEAINGRDAIRAARLLRPDLIVLDLVMPAMNGLTAAHVLKQLMPAVPLILYGSADKIVRQRTRALGIAALISKADPQDAVANLARTLLSEKKNAVIGRPTSLTQSSVAAVIADA